MTTLTAGRASRATRVDTTGRSGRATFIAWMLVLVLVVIGTLALDDHVIAMPDVSKASVGVVTAVLGDAGQPSPLAAAGPRIDASQDAATPPTAAQDGRSATGLHGYRLVRCWQRAHRLGQDPAPCRTARP